MIKRYHTALFPVTLLAAIAAGCSGEPSASETNESTPVSTAPEMTVYKSPTCGCCAEWVAYMEEAGFETTTVERDDVDPIKAELGLTDPRLRSCHTAVVDGYVIEGHVPADDVRRLLAERPDVVGLTAPGMPMMSPGMGSREPRDYDVIAFDADGRQRVWSSY